MSNSGSWNFERFSLFREKPVNVKFIRIDRFNCKWLGKLIRFHAACSLKSLFRAELCLLSQCRSPYQKGLINWIQSRFCLSFILFRMFEHFVSSIDLQSIECSTDSNIIFSLRNNSLLAEKRRCTRTIFNVDRIKIVKSGSKRNGWNCWAYFHFFSSSLDWSNCFSTPLFPFSRRL